METESYLHFTSPITHFQSLDQYYTIFKITRGNLTNQLTFWQNPSELRTIKMPTGSNCQRQLTSPQAGL